MLYGILGFCGAFFINKLWEAWEAHKKKNDEAKDTTVKELTDAVEKLEKTIIRFEYKIESLEKASVEIPQIKKDINGLGEKLRVHIIEGHEA